MAPEVIVRSRRKRPDGEGTDAVPAGLEMARK